MLIGKRTTGKDVRLNDNFSFLSNQIGPAIFENSKFSFSPGVRIVG